MKIDDRDGDEKGHDRRHDAIAGRGHVVHVLGAKNNVDGHSGENAANNFNRSVHGIFWMAPNARTISNARQHVRGTGWSDALFFQ